MIMFSHLRRSSLMVSLPLTLALAISGAFVGADVASAQAAPLSRPALAGIPAKQRSAVSQALTAATGVSASNIVATDACSTPAAGASGCDAEVLRVKSSGAFVRPKRPSVSALTSPAAPALSFSAAASNPFAEPASASQPLSGSPAWLQQAYDTSWLSANRGSSDTIAIVDDGADPTAASDLATYRSYFDLPACTVASGCLSIVDEWGQTQAQAGSSWPAENTGWLMEESLDLDAVSALCPNCKIVFVEASSNYDSDLDQAEATAAAWPGVDQISDSWGRQSTTPVNEFDYPGVAVFASTGDQGYQGTDVQWPASSPDVNEVGGTTLSTDYSGTIGGRGFTETAWDDAGSGCATSIAEPSWQTQTACAGRGEADVSADADPSTGLDIYDSYDGGWLVVGGTSLSSPLTAAFVAVAGINADSPSWSYTDASELHDITSGANDGGSGDTAGGGTCSTAVCNAGVGWDGPTGNGSINGEMAATGAAPGISGPGDCGEFCGSDLGYVAASTSTTLTLDAQVETNGLQTSYYWEFGTSKPPTGATDTAWTTIPASGSPSQATANISGLTEGTAYYYRLVASNSDGTTYGYTFAVETPPGAPTATVVPSITGTAGEGYQLFLQSGTWSGDPTTYSFEWLRNDGSGWQVVQGSGTTNQFYDPGSADIGDYFEGVVTVGNSGGTTTYTTPEVGPVVSGAPTNAGLPSVLGTVAAGDTLSSYVGEWSGPFSSFTYGYQWQVQAAGAWNNITGATSSAYTPTVSQIGEDLRLQVTAEDTYGDTTASTTSTAAVAAGVPVNGALPSISGTAQRLSTLTATSGTWDWSGYSYAYQWQRCSGDTCSNIAGATAASYTAIQADEGDTLQVAVTAFVGNGLATATSAATAAVTGVPPANAAAPTVSGSVQTGFSATGGSWIPSDVTLAYQWQDCDPSGNDCSAITGATASTYRAQLSDDGDSLRVAVTGSNGDGSLTQQSNLTGVLDTDIPQNLTPPAISGVAEPGQQLQTDGGTWQPSNLVLTYQWQDCNSSGCTNIAGATSTAYGVQDSDAGYELDVVVTGSNDDGSLTETATPTAYVGRAPVLQAPPSAPTTSDPSLTPGAGLTAPAGSYDTAEPSASGSWSNSSATITYTFYDCPADATSLDTSTCSPVAINDTGEYMVQDSDVGFTLGFTVTVTDAGGSTVEDSPLSAVVQPLASGTPDPGTGTTTGSGGGSGSGTIAGGGTNTTGGGTTTGKGTGTTTGSSDPPTLTWTGGLPGGLGLIGEVLTSTTATTASASSHEQFVRCSTACSLVGKPGASYTVSKGDAGALLRLALTTTASGTSTTTYSSKFVGPVLAPQVAGALISRGSVKLRSSKHGVFATAHLTSKRTHGKASTTITVKRGAVKGSLTAWACPTALTRSGLPQPCTRPVRLSETPTIKVAAPGRYAVVVKR
jgi:hypothetical protein